MCLINVTVFWPWYFLDSMKNNQNGLFIEKQSKLKQFICAVHWLQLNQGKNMSFLDLARFMKESVWFFNVLHVAAHLEERLRVEWEECASAVLGGGGGGVKWGFRGRGWEGREGWQIWRLGWPLKETLCWSQPEVVRSPRLCHHLHRCLQCR